MALQHRFYPSARIDHFLKNQRMHCDYTNMQQVMVNFRHHMQQGLMPHAQSSLLMIPTYVRLPKQILAHKPVIAMDAGGTNLRKALVSFDDQGKILIENFDQTAMPGSDGSARTKDQFYHELARFVLPESKNSAYMGFCFSYPTQSTPEADGKVLFFSKEIDAPEVVGSYVGLSLREAVMKLDANTQLQRVIVMNDTVSTLLSGMLTAKEHRYSSYIGLILGTGMNMAYVERNKKISKISHQDSNGSQVINIEAGGFLSVLRGTMDYRLDQETSAPGKFALEKMVSGAYFGRLCALTIEAACDEGGIFDDDTANLLRPILDEIDTKVISEYHNDMHSSDNILGLVLHEVALSQRELVGQIIANLLQRMAKLVASVLSGVILESGEGFLAQEPICITVDGSTFYGFEGLKEEIQRLMQEEILVGAYKRYFTLTYIENASLVGAAMAAYTF
ncbi:hypothetical protein PVA45_07980 (plasmid) [Entomospira entomophila]|uniref:Hexokinase n=1 Tax=Entomospira entomophila TaxID=2719988 RepID=A0A968KS49_9SPIO|nr:hypothetical protein [Entomospira entomophilus]NIZ41443.1 hypothetical protein [Entomospira entomophilus]WDI36392.1 hypothetical protein PVA45_07980 [Entomospira entomophilus]